MTEQGHMWLRHGWYRSKDRPMELKQWFRRLNRLAISGTRARAMGFEFRRIEWGGLEYKFLDCGIDI